MIEASNRAVRDAAPSQPSTGGSLIVGRAVPEHAVVARPLLTLSASHVIQPDRFDLVWARARALIREERHAEALFCFDRALEMRPDQPVVHFIRGLALLTLDSNEEALRALDRALEVGAQPSECERGRARALIKLNRHEEALTALDAAIVLDPNNADLHSERGCLLKTWALPNHQMAMLSFETAMRLNPRNAMFPYNRALVHFELQRCEESIRGYRAALDLDPTHAKTRLALAFSLFQRGDFEEAWKNHESRKMAFVKDVPLTMWEGEPLDDRVLLIRHEQGLGDGLQFLRYVHAASAKGKVVVQTIPALYDLAARMCGPIPVVTMGMPLPECHVQCSQMSLPFLLGMSAHIPCADGYLRADPVKVEAWRARLGPRRGMRVGLAWSGNPLHENDAIRSIPLREFVECMAPGVEYVSLQRDIRAQDEAAFRATPELRHFGEDLRDLDDTAALCELMDVVISVDTSVAHLAGALGKPLRLLIPATPDWRWMLEREDTPWYSRARIFRQEKWFDWVAVLHRVRAEQAALSPGH